MFCCFYSRALLSMLSTIPPMLVVEDLVPTLLPLELYDEDRLHAGAVAGG
jgi:hypothetical protein